MRFSTCTALLAIAIGFLGASSAPADAGMITTLFNTGVETNSLAGLPSSMVAQGDIDPHWTITSAVAPDQAGPAYVTLNNGYPFTGPSGAWGADSNLSAWISPHPNENSLNGGAENEPAGLYTYQTTFDMSGLDPTTAQITGLLFADNLIDSVILNGVDLGSFNSSFTGSPFTISTGFTSGINVLDFVVENLPPRHADPSGFRFEGIGIANALVPEPSSIMLTVTGVLSIAIAFISRFRSRVN